jgi:hypothetical protein
MSTPLPCSECFGWGWRPYFVETIEGEREMAWKLCPDCGNGWPFPPLAKGAGTSPALLPQRFAEAVWSSSRSESSIETSTSGTESAPDARSANPQTRWPTVRASASTRNPYASRRLEVDAPR